MDPFGRPTHQHHRRDDDDDYRPSNQPPPPYFDAPEPPRPHFPPADPYSRPAPPQPHFLGDPYSRPAPPPPPPHSANVHHTSHAPGGPPDYYDRPPPPQQPHPPSYGANYASDPYDRPPPPPTQQVTHVSHEPHHHRPHMPSIVHGHPHNKLSELENKPSVRVYCKAETNYSLTIRDGQVILVRSNPSDPYQQWIKDEKNSIRVKDEQGFPSFSLVNKATGQAIKHSIGATYPVQLTPYNPDVLDESVLWTESVDLGDSYRTIRMVNNIRLNFDAFDGNKNRGGVHDGTTIVLWEWGKGENQRWKIVPY